MGLDLGPSVYQTETTSKSWPKCYVCSRKLGHLYPVEVYGIATREPPALMRSRYRLVVEVECHGAKQRFTMEIPRHFGLAGEQLAMGRCLVFLPGVQGRFKVMQMRHT